MNQAVILLSGGLDSTTCLAIAHSQGFACHALSIAYGQRNEAELLAASNIARYFGATHQLFAYPLHVFKGSALTDSTLVVPEYTNSNEIPITYVPARNTNFLAIALAYAEVIAAYDIFIGVSAIDYSHYPDCRPEYIEAFEKLANLATKAGTQGHRFRIHAPLIQLNKAQTILTGMALGVDYSMTRSCYRLDPQGMACGNCDSCYFRKKGFRDAQLIDPTHYHLNQTNDATADAPESRHLV